MPRISVLTVSAREGGLELPQRALNKQTFEDFEWVIVCPFDINVSATFPVKVLRDPPRPKNFYWSLNRAYNEGLRHCDGELVVSLQDRIYITPQGLEKFWYAYQDKKACITGVGDQYSELDERGIPINKVWHDPRKRDDYGSFYECFPKDIEFNYCAIPKQAFYDVGGFDEELDRWAGGDNISVMERIDEVGYKSWIDQTNESFTLRHGRLPNWDERHSLHGPYYERKDQLIKEGLWPHLNYLQKDDIKK